MSDSPKYWFPAKSNGCGWGLPSSWQGWTVLIGYILLVFSGFPIIDTKVNLMGFVLYTQFLSAILIFICWRKGEPQRGQWGKSKDN